VPEAIARCEEILGRPLADRQAEALALCSLSCLCAMDGDFDEARRLQTRGRSYLVDLGATVLTAFAAVAGARIELLASDPERAESEIRQVYETLGLLGERYFRPALGAYLAEALYQQGRHEEAASTVSSVQDVADPDDVETQALWRLVQAKILAGLGEKESAVALARESVHLTESMDSPVIQADAKLVLAEVLAAVEDADAFHELVEAARTLYHSKGNAVAAVRAGALLAAATVGGASVAGR
jgi:ATP/maltotriose-dependent transcriptional regulator MalT